MAPGSNVMPFSNWVYAVTAVSIVMNLVGMWGRFRLSRIDADRVKAEARLAALFHPRITAPEIARLTPTAAHRTVEHRTEVADVIATLDRLSRACQRESKSWSADMGQEMPYRYQEQLMAEVTSALRAFQARVAELEGEAVPSPPRFADALSPKTIEVAAAAVSEGRTEAGRR